MLELYGLPPEQFTAARNQLAKALDDSRASAAVKALRKPTAAAWLANRLVRIAPDQIAELTEFGDRLRDAHRTGDRAGLKKLTPRRHTLVDRLVNAATADATSHGRTVTATASERLAATLDAAVVDPAAAQRLRTGRLTTGLRHVGFGLLDETGAPIQSSTPAPTRPSGRATTVKTPQHKPTRTKSTTVRPSKTRPDELLRRRRAELDDQLRQLEADHEDAERDRREAESELDANEHHISDMQTAIERLTDELERVRRELRQAQSRTQKLERTLTRATRTAAATARRRDAQQQRLEALNG